MTSGEEVEGPVLAAVGRLELVAQAELPLVLQLQTHNGLPQGAAVLADHTEGGSYATTHTYSISFRKDPCSTQTQPHTHTVLASEKTRVGLKLSTLDMGDRRASKEAKTYGC